MMDMIERMARAFVDALGKQNPGVEWVGDGDPLDNQCLDGHFDLIAAMKAAVAVMQPTDPGIPVYRHPDATDEFVKE